MRSSEIPIQSPVPLAESELKNFYFKERAAMTPEDQAIQYCTRIKGLLLNSPDRLIPDGLKVRIKNWQVPFSPQEILHTICEAQHNPEASKFVFSVLDIELDLALQRGNYTEEQKESIFKKALEDFQK